MNLPTFKTDLFELDNAEMMNANHPNTFWIPSKEKRETLKIGELVKLVFHILEHKDSTATSIERMWVDIKDIKPPFYIGKLDNDPLNSHCIKYGQEVVFQAIHIIDIYEDNGV